MSKLLDSDYMQKANDANASGHASVYRDKNNPNDPRNIEWHLGGKWITRKNDIPSFGGTSCFHYALARNGCGNPVHYRHKVVYFKTWGTTSPESISLVDMMKHTKGKEYDSYGWLETEFFYVVNEKGTKSWEFLKCCNIGTNY